MRDAVDRLLTRAYQARRKHRPNDAELDLVEAVGLCRKADVREQLARALTALGQIERDLGRADTALEHYEEAAAIYRAEGDELKLAHTVRHAGDIQREEGRVELAEPCYHEALNLYRSHERTAPLDLANAIRGFALLKEDSGETAEAKLHWEEARGLYADVNVEAGVKESSHRLALLARRRTAE